MTRSDGISAAKTARAQYAEALRSPDLLDLFETQGAGTAVQNCGPNAVVSASGVKLAALPFGVGSTVAARYQGRREFYLARVTCIHNCQTRVDVEWLRPAGGAVADRKYLCTTGLDETAHNRGLSIKEDIRAPNKNGTCNTGAQKAKQNVPDLLDMGSLDKAPAADGVMDLLGETVSETKSGSGASAAACQPATFQNCHTASMQSCTQQPGYTWGATMHGAPLGYAQQWPQTGMGALGWNVPNAQPFPRTAPAPAQPAPMLPAQINMTQQVMKSRPHGSTTSQKKPEKFNFVSDLLTEASKTAAG
jgi:hypothetical protein